MDCIVPTEDTMRIRELVRLLDAALPCTGLQQGPPPALLLQGPPGCGKARLTWAALGSLDPLRCGES